jgi:hypothetical protein
MLYKIGNMQLAGGLDSATLAVLLYQLYVSLEVHGLRHSDDKNRSSMNMHGTSVFVP